MNLLNIALNKIGDRLHDRFAGPETGGMMGALMHQSQPPASGAAQTLQQAAMPAQQGATAEQEQLAKANGFPSYEAMALWYKQRSAPHTGTVQGQGQPAPPAPPAQSAPPPQNENAYTRIMNAFNRALGSH